VERIKQWKLDMLRYVDMNYPEIDRDILQKKQISKETEQTLRHALDNFTLSWS
jgi:F-type H+-transporting ATPase subunit alpha